MNGAVRPGRWERILSWPGAPATYILLITNGLFDLTSP